MEHPNPIAEEAWNTGQSKNRESHPSSASLEEKIIELDELLESRSWLEQQASNDEETLASDVDRRDDSHLLALQNELKAAEMLLVSGGSVHYAGETTEMGNNYVAEKYERAEAGAGAGKETICTQSSHRKNVKELKGGNGQKDRVRSVCFSQEVAEHEIECDLNGPIAPRPNLLETISDQHEMEHHHFLRLRHLTAVPQEDGNAQCHTFSKDIEEKNCRHAAPFQLTRNPFDGCSVADDIEMNVPFEFHTATFGSGGRQHGEISPLTDCRYFAYEENAEMQVGVEKDLKRYSNQWQYEDVFSNPFYVEGSANCDWQTKAKSNRSLENGADTNNIDTSKDSGSRERIPISKSTKSAESIFPNDVFDIESSNPFGIGSFTDFNWQANVKTNRSLENVADTNTINVSEDIGSRERIPKAKSAKFTGFFPNNPFDIAGPNPFDIESSTDRDWQAKAKTNRSLDRGADTNTFDARKDIGSRERIPISKSKKCTGSLIFSNNPFDIEGSNPLDIERFTEYDCQAKAKTKRSLKHVADINTINACKDIGFKDRLRTLKSKKSAGLLFCVFQILFHAALIKVFIFKLLSSHPIDFTESSPISNLCNIDNCSDSIPLSLGQNGQRTVHGTIDGSVLHNTREKKSGCTFNSDQSAVWYSVIGGGRKLSVALYSDTENPSTTFSILIGSCDALEGIHGPPECCGSPDRPQTLSWKTEKGKQYSIAVHSNATNGMESYKLQVWDSRYTAMLLSENSERRNGNHIPSWAIGWPIGIVSIFGLLVVFS
eukprot:scaffold3618_cov129-Cylindrotheca_fusiformis.AAC.8